MKYAVLIIYKTLVFESILLFLKNSEYQNYLANLVEINNDLQKLNSDFILKDTLVISFLLALVSCFFKFLNNSDHIKFFILDFVVYLSAIIFLFSNDRFSIIQLILSMFIYLTSSISFELFFSQKHFNRTITVILFITFLLGLVFIDRNNLKESIEYVQTKESNEIFLNQYVRGTASLNLPLFQNRRIITNNEELLVKIYDNCCYDLTYEYTGGKPGGFIDEIEGKLIHLTGDARFFHIQSDDKYSNTDSLIRTELTSNIEEIIKDKKLFEKGRVSIRGMKSNENLLYLSYIDEISPACFTLSVAKAEINFESKEVNVSSFYQPKQCMSNSDSSNFNLGSQEECAKNLECLEAEGAFNMHSTGGQIEFHKGKMVLAVGEFGVLPEAQNDENIFGKIISINMENKKIETISKGHRNIQGLFRLENNLISTEHGPTGGDEINIINLDFNSSQQNYGWPIASYGEIPVNRFPNQATAYKSHEKYNLIEPLHYFTPSIGISSISSMNNGNFLVASLKANKIFIIDTSLSQKLYGGNNVLSIGINIGDRIRDIHYYELEDLYFLILETRPAIAILKFTK